MAGKVKGITIEIGGDAQPLQKALKDVNSSAANLKSELRELDRLLKLDPTNTTLLAQKQTVLAKQIETTSEKLQRLKSVQEQVEEQFANKQIGEEQYRSFQREVEKTELTLQDLQEQSAKTDAEIRNAGKGAKESGTNVESSRAKWENFGNTLKKVATVAAEAAAAATAALAAGAVKLGKEVVSAYADYEQLSGGVKTLFGTEAASVEEYAASVGKSVSDVQAEYDSLTKAQNTVFDNAANAYKTAGLSANEYMETVTGFSASLISSLGGDTEKAAKYADTAITDMSDNANKMGTSMESIQNAYSGFAKGQYNMLDNLKLGYGGTKEEMQRLLTDAQAISGVEYDISSYADIIDAIHTIQEEMGIAGTTAAEAEGTISGSIGMLKSSFSNLLAGLGNEEAEIDGLIDNVVNSFGLVTKNITPIVENLAKVLPDAINGMVEAVAPLLPGLLETGVSILESLLEGIITALPELTATASSIILSLVDSIVSALPLVLEASVQLISTLAQGIAEATPELVPTIVEIVTTFATTLVENLPTLIEAVMQIVSGVATGLINALPTIVAALPQIVQGIADALVALIPSIAECGVTVFTALVEDLPTIIEGIVAALPQIIDAMTNGLTELIPKIVLCGVDLLVALVTNLPQIIVTIGGAMPQIANAMMEGLRNFRGSMAEVGRDLFSQLITRGGEALAEIGGFVSSLMSNILSVISGWFSSFAEVGYNIVTGIWSGLSSGWGWLTEQVSSLASSLLSAAKRALGIHSPSTKFRDEIGKMMAAGIGEGFNTETDSVFAGMQTKLKAEEKKLATSVTNTSTVTNNSTSLGGINIYITGGIGTTAEAQSIGDTLAGRIQQQLRYKGVLSLA